jgi:hypothetical protein
MGQHPVLQPCLRWRRLRRDTPDGPRHALATGPLTELPPSTISGEPVVGIQGDVSLQGAPPNSVAATVYISRSSKPLPVSATYSYSNGASARIALSQWGEHLLLQPPTQVIAQSALQPVGHRSATATAEPRTRTRNPKLSAPVGFTSGTTQVPETGTWHATGTTTASIGYSDGGVGPTVHRVWTIVRSCSQTCTYTLIRSFVGDGIASVIRAALVHKSDGWHATWPAQRLTCAGTAADPIYWDQQEGLDPTLHRRRPRRAGERKQVLLHAKVRLRPSIGDLASDLRQLLDLDDNYIPDERTCGARPGPSDAERYQRPITASRADVTCGRECGPTGTPRCRSGSKTCGRSGLTRATLTSSCLLSLSPDAKRAPLIDWPSGVAAT